MRSTQPFRLLSRWAFCLGLVAGAGSVLAAPSASSVDIRLERNPLADELHSPHLVLSQDYKGFRCQTDHVPSHRISVKGLQSLASPVKQETIPADCRLVLVWGATKSCYVAHRNPLVDDVIQWCLNI